MKSIKNIMTVAVISSVFTGCAMDTFHKVGTPAKQGNNKVCYQLNEKNPKMNTGVSSDIDSELQKRGYLTTCDESSNKLYVRHFKTHSMVVGDTIGYNIKLTDNKGNLLIESQDMVMRPMMQRSGLISTVGDVVDEAYGKKH